ncbi:MAG: exodeoxyribonuclease I [Granulosicoccus sp.]|nr:exodeoxyribonuclease I [Granulosicoccus sp.]
MNTPGFYWFDYETFGKFPAWDRPCQFAGIRTNENLEIIDDPLVLYCKQANDYLPHPQACRVTGLTPQLVNDKGIIEAKFIETVVKEIGKPGTCSVGYNSLRFDDEFTRHTLFRNFHEPYEYEWKDGNTRWDLLDVIRLTRVLRPEGLNWPVKEDGTASNRLEDLSRVNAIEHSNAHDALSDVYATLGMARLIKQSQPRLFDYALQHRGKQQVTQLLNLKKREPCLYISGMIPASRHHLGVIIPIARHPQRQNSLIVFDLRHDPSDLVRMSAHDIEQWLYASGTSGTTHTASRPGLHTVQINKCPVLAPLQTLRQQDALRLSVDLDDIRRHRAVADALYEPEVTANIIEAMSLSTPASIEDVDGTLYTGGFPDPDDRQRMSLIRNALPTEIEQKAAYFNDKRLQELAWRYQARNFPESLCDTQIERWREHCASRLRASNAPWLSYAEFCHQLENTDWSDSEQNLKQSLETYGQQIWSFATDRLLAN